MVSGPREPYGTVLIAPGLLYAEHLLRQFSIFGREALVLKALKERIPEGLEGLYANVVADLQHHTPHKELEAMKILLFWLAHPYRPLTLAECLSLLEITSNDFFDLERGLQGRQLARVLRLGDLEERVTNTGDEDVKLNIQDQKSSEAPFDDGNLPLKFQQRSLRAFFRDCSEGLRTLPKDANREIFILCSDILCGQRPNAHEGLRQYAARYAILHLSWTAIQEGTEHDKIRTLNALGTLMSNETKAATVIETLGVDYNEINESFDSGVLMRDMAYWAGLAVALGDRLNDATCHWAKSVNADVHSAFEPLAQGHIANWFQAEDAKTALRSFKFARSAINMVSDHPLSLFELLHLHLFLCSGIGIVLYCNRASRVQKSSEFKRAVCPTTVRPVMRSSMTEVVAHSANRSR